MLRVYCLHREAWVLVWAEDVHSIVSRDGRHEVRYRCACGRDETHVIERSVAALDATGADH